MTPEEKDNIDQLATMAIAVIMKKYELNDTYLIKPLIEAFQAGVGFMHDHAEVRL